MWLPHGHRGTLRLLDVLSPAQPSPAPPSSAQMSPAQLSPAQSSPAQLSPAQLSPAQLSPDQHSPAQPSSAQRSPAQLSPAQPSPAQSTAQPSSAQLSPAQLHLSFNKFYEYEVCFLGPFFGTWAQKAGFLTRNWAHFKGRVCVRFCDLIFFGGGSACDNFQIDSMAISHPVDTRGFRVVAPFDAGYRVLGGIVWDTIL